MKAELKYTRKGATITDVETGQATTYFQKGKDQVPSVNAAKRESRILQGGALGHGSLQVKG